MSVVCALSDRIAVVTGVGGSVEREIVVGRLQGWTKGTL